MGKKILVVDNDRFIVEFMTDLLTEAGHDVITAQDGLSALEILKEDVPDIVFVDLIMPNISGDKLCRVIRKTPHLKNVYIAVVSATVAEEPTRFADLGADTSIAKGPFDEMSKRILAAVDQADQACSPSLEETAAGLQGIYRRGITEELLSIQRHLETILNNISEGVLELNFEGKIIFANNIALSLLGGSEEKLLGRRFIDLFEGTDRKKIDDLMEDIGAGLPEIIDPFRVQVTGETMLLKILPVEDNMVWSVIVIAVPLRKITTHQ
ncbi:MAG: response regulator [Deltaproteobacteria bacterium]|nr:response regulator [Deltaproteobacteria bacterium]